MQCLHSSCRNRFHWQITCSSLHASLSSFGSCVSPDISHNTLDVYATEVICLCLGPVRQGVPLQVLTCCMLGCCSSTLFSTSTTNAASVLRSSDQLHEVVTLACELLPPLPDVSTVMLANLPPARQISGKSSQLSGSYSSSPAGPRIFRSVYVHSTVCPLLSSASAGRILLPLLTDSETSACDCSCTCKHAVIGYKTAACKN